MDRWLDEVVSLNMSRVGGNASPSVFDPSSTDGTVFDEGTVFIRGLLTGLRLDLSTVYYMQPRWCSGEHTLTIVSLLPHLLMKSHREVLQKSRLAGRPSVEQESTVQLNALQHKAGYSRRLQISDDRCILRGSFVPQLASRLNESFCCRRSSLNTSSASWCNPCLMHTCNPKTT